MVPKDLKSGFLAGDLFFLTFKPRRWANRDQPMQLLFVYYVHDLGRACLPLFILVFVRFVHLVLHMGGGALYTGIVDGTTEVLLVKS